MVNREIAFKTVCLAQYIADDYSNYVNGFGDEEWVPEYIDVNIGQYVIDDNGTNDGQYTLIMEINDISLEFWFNDDKPHGQIQPKLDLDWFFEFVDDCPNSDIMNWVDEIEDIIQSELISNIYDNDELDDIIDSRL